MSFDPTRPLVLTRFKTILGHNREAGTPLVVITEPDKPSNPGEVDELLAARLWKSGVAVYAEDHLPTPVETPEAAAIRLSAEALRDAGPDGDVVVTDLMIWPQDDAETGKKAGDRVTKDDLIAIAAREGATVPSGASMADLVRSITERRAAGLAAIPTNTVIAPTGYAGTASLGTGDGPVTATKTDSGNTSKSAE